MILNLLMIYPYSVTAIGEEAQSVCNSADVVPFTAFFECCASHVWLIFAPCVVAIFYGSLRVLSRWDREKEDELLEVSDCPGLASALEFIMGFVSIFVDLLAAAANFKVDGSNAARCFAVGSCFHSVGIVAAELKKDGALNIAILCAEIGQILELVPFLFINQAAGVTAFLMMATLGVAIVFSIYDRIEKRNQQSLTWERGDFKSAMGINQFTLAVVVAVAFFSTLKGSYLLLLLPEVPVE
eukprot:CAMPEP_0172545272 /NCGR_PEP_ID=MMETSP1067-20121228/15227_1 /TAXON_ID=265564 ORGANISM="Thalassiosira punctigera, Strain Tpunct2005C2" /NCGR_SAMPLE_ID=MMETSP1067 /ASSEMBLY_ACC=CAM_ASM_000444 /LENGTH=240 /DNA_ID=CAMNT_0013331983 /DNA_START=287 /DNA_END=1006 /DNA_ORIENTATION=-